MKIDPIRVGAALSVLAMILESISPTMFYFLPIAGGGIEQFAVFIGLAYIAEELYLSVSR